MHLKFAGGAIWGKSNRADNDKKRISRETWTGKIQ